MQLKLNGISSECNDVITVAGLLHQIKLNLPSAVLLEPAMLYWPNMLLQYFSTKYKLGYVTGGSIAFKVQKDWLWHPERSEGTTMYVGPEGL